MSFEIRDNIVYLTVSTGGSHSTKIRPQGFKTVQACNHDVIYVKDDRYYYWVRGIKIVRFSAGTLEVIDEDYARDADRVFYQGESIPGADPATFKVVPNTYYFAYDKNQVYAASSSGEGLQILKDVDTHTLVFFRESSYFCDALHLFYYNHHFIEYANHGDALAKCEEHDTSFTSPIFYKRVDYDHVDTGLTETEKNEIITREGNLVRYLRHHVPHADAWWHWDDKYYGSLKNIGFDFYTDGRRLFYKFEQEALHEQPLHDYPFPFAHPKGTPYYSAIRYADALSFKALNGYYSKDRHRVYHLARPIEADPASFEIINGSFAKDKTGVWYNGQPVKGGLDLPSFQPIPVKSPGHSYWFAKDRHRLYATQYGIRIGKYAGYATQLVPLKNADPASFQMISGIWSKDKNNVYCYGIIWKKIDPATFELLLEITHHTSYVKDKNHLYNANGRRVIKGIDGGSFVLLNKYWGKDKNNVFSFESDRIIKRLDSPTFHPTGPHGEAEDKNGPYKKKS